MENMLMKICTTRKDIHLALLSEKGRPDNIVLMF